MGVFWVAFMVFLSACLVPAPSCAESLEQGVSLLTSRRYDEAIQTFSRVIAELPGHFKAYNNRGAAWFGKGDYDRAIEDYSRALEMNPYYAEAYNNRGAAWFLKGEHDRAIGDFSRALEMAPGYAEAYRNRGAAWLGKENPEKATADFTRAIEMASCDAQALHYRGLAWFKREDCGRAADDFRRALECRPDSPAVFNQLAWVLAVCPDSRHRNGNEAVAWARRAVEADARANYLDTLAAALAETGRYAEAAVTQQEVVRLVAGDGAAPAEYLARLDAYRNSRTWREGQPPPVVSAAAAHPYTVHVASFRNPSGALQQVDALRAGGQPAFSWGVRLDEQGTWYRVGVGSYGTSRAAREAAESLRRESIGYAKVIRTPYAVQILLTDSEEALKAAEASLNAEGHRAYRLAAQDGGGRFRILVGAFGSAEEAGELARQLLGSIPGSVVITR